MRKRGGASRKVKYIAGINPELGLVDQWKIVSFARRRPWVQIPASPFLVYVHAPDNRGLFSGKDRWQLFCAAR